METLMTTVYPVGERAVTLQCLGMITLENQRKIWWIANQINPNELSDIISGMNNITVIFDPLKHSTEQYIDLLNTLWAKTNTIDFTSTTTGKTIEIPVSYGGKLGPDLKEVADFHNLSIDEVIKRHTEVLYTVFFIGFMPGFAYLGGLDQSLITPRRATPRTLIAQGSVGISGQQTGIYPSASPGGWQIIGNTSVALFDPQRIQPSLLLSGDRLKFSVDRIDYD